MSRFKLNAQDGKARAGIYTTPHGSFNTPAFMPVGTQGSVKGVDVERLKEAHTQVLLVNTYHLWLRPGPEQVRELGGIHRFSGWPDPILSDSGGYQVFSLKGMRKINENGVEFRSHLDGTKYFLTPEKSIEIQEELGVDIAMVLDECPAAGLSFAEVERSLALTHSWAERSLRARKNSDTSVFGITQGGTSFELRTRSAEVLGAQPFDGMAIGGLSVGEPVPVMYEVLSYHAAQLPAHKIRYLMGVGTPRDLVQAVSEGIDLFDCVMPTRAGRFGRAFVKGEAPFINIKNSRFQAQCSPLDESCKCIACRNYSRGYIHHLFRANEMLGPQLLSVHNLTHYLCLMREMQVAVAEGRFEKLHKYEMLRWRELEAEDNEAQT